MEDELDKDNESYLDGLLETIGQEPPYETDRRRKAAERAKSGNNKASSKDVTVDSLEEEFDLDDLDDSFLEDIDLDEFISPIEDKDDSKKIDTEELLSDETEIDGDTEEAVAADGLVESENLETPVDDNSAELDSSMEKAVEEDNPVSEVSDVEMEAGEETAAEIGSEIGGEIDGDTAGEIGSELGVEIGEEIGVELGSEIGAEQAEDDSGEISFEEAGLVVDDEPLPIVNPLDDIGEPEVLSDKEIKSKKQSKKKVEKKAEGEKKGLFAKIYNKLFANIPLTEEEIAAIPTPEQEEAAKKEKEAEAAKKKEDKKAAAEAAKKQKAEEAKKKAADNKAKKAAKDAAKKAAKKEAELKRLRAEALEQPEGKINKAGAIIIFLFFIVAAAVVIVGTSIFSYDISIADATYKFGNRKYTEAYEDIRGLEIKEKDMELHDKIYTVMFVNKQLNSYNNFFAMGDYSAALDSLIKGLSRYDKYIALARQLGIHTDLDYVRKQIMAELQKVYGVSEREALELMEMTDKQEYSERIYSIVSKLDTKSLEADREKDELVP